MRDLLLLAIHLLVTLTKFVRPGGVRAVAAESLLLKHQILISNRSRQRAPNLTSLDRFVLGLITLFVSPRQVPKLGALVKPATLLKFHKALVDRKYHLLFSSSSRRRKPGPKGPSAELIAAIVEMKRRNARFGCMRIAQQISYTFGVQIDKDIVRRVLAKHYRPGDSGSNGPSWLTLIAQTKDSLWSLDLFRCESILLRSHWVLVVMDVFTRRLIGFGVEPGAIDGVSVCRMFNHAVAGLVVLLCRPTQSVQAENLFLRRQLALFKERLKEWTAHYNRGRCHSALGPGVPDPPQRPAVIPKSKSRHRLAADVLVLARSVLGGLHHEYSLETAPASA